SEDNIDKLLGNQNCAGAPCSKLQVFEYNLFRGLYNSQEPKDYQN
ncbi:MAG: hypothetical protein QG646_453, partial [Euryarchaeota archaeon]|nr:hypothetical protein [Euryarchaeota archaeon]